MTPDRNAPATRGDLDDLRTELKSDLAGLRTELKSDLAGLESGLAELKSELTAEMGSLEARMTKTNVMEMSRIANVIMEHTASLIRASGDHPRAIEERLDAHIADARVHRRPSRR